MCLLRNYAGKMNWKRSVEEWLMISAPVYTDDAGTDLFVAVKIEQRPSPSTING